jgi:1,2-phenylacetyl-CoA epoxidase catalytic subunit
LVSRLALSVADTELALASAFAEHINSTVDIKQRIELARLMQDKLSIAQKLYEMLEGFGFHAKEYLTEAQSHHITACGDCQHLGLSALKYPLKDWADVGAATFLVGNAIATEFVEAKLSSYLPWADHARESLPVERRSIESALGIIISFKKSAEDRQRIQEALDSWYVRIRSCYATWLLDEDSARAMGIRRRSTQAMVKQWTTVSTEELAALGFALG